MPWFARQRFDCWALSLEGHGNSEGRAHLDALGINDYRRDLLSSLSQFQTPPVIIAHSMGGFVLQQLYGRVPLAGAALLASVPPSGIAASTLRLMTQAPALFMKLNRYQQGQYFPGAEELRGLLFSSDLPAADIARWLPNLQPESQRAIYDMTLVSPWQRPPQQACPTLVLGAENDLLISAGDVNATAQALGVQASILPNSSHMLMLDTRWRACAETLLAWLRQDVIRQAGTAT